ncbi:hypothetical protein AXF42_Ash001712 [Apostasia shenzhenica]|uniref:Uncharacterized protein n=1 Tax=Apostasia shenzhenica TaxID=1088818 RepID=A0A2I0AB03_9ASPA|nr:hypothetical protein AXF42_Ash001712 [Apostasia shenzhenica]
MKVVRPRLAASIFPFRRTDYSDFAAAAACSPFVAVCRRVAGDSTLALIALEGCRSVFQLLLILLTPYSPPIHLPLQILRSNRLLRRVSFFVLSHSIILMKIFE